MKLKNNGLEEQTVKIVGFYLNHLAANVSLEDPESVKEFIANKNVNSGFKGNLVKAYNYYALVNNIVWERPRYRWEQNKPKIPSEETLNKIIASCGWKHSVVFTLLKETGAMPKELSEVALRDIDFDKETLTIRDRKGHASRTIKLKADAETMARRPWVHQRAPASHQDIWRRVPNGASDLLQQVVDISTDRSEVIRKIRSPQTRLIHTLEVPIDRHMNCIDSKC